MKSVRGNVLPLVLGILLVLSILVTSMLRMPGTLRRTVALVAKETQEMYLAESAVLSKLEGFPEGYVTDIPSVESRILGPWTLWRTAWQTDNQIRKFQFVLGNEYGQFSTSEWMRCSVLLENNLHENILHAKNLKNLSGNRRFFRLDSSDALQGAFALNLSAGDLTLDLGGNEAFGVIPKRSLVHSFMANVEGDVKIRGSVHFDTLRIYASGTVTLQGNVTADFVEIFGLAGIALTGKVSLAGVLLSKQSIEISDHVKMNFPSVAVAVGYRGNRLALYGKSVFEGLAIAPSGVVERDSSATLLDSMKTLLPFCMDSRHIVFERRRL
jgi:hypothetical protein